MTEIQERLTAAFEAMGEWAPHDPDLLGTVRARAGRRWPSPRIAVVAAGVAAAALAGTGVALLGDDAETPQPAAWSCPAEVGPALVPEWARTGFSDPEPSMPYVGSDRDGIVGILFGQPLTSPVAEGRGNKVLWVAREDAGALAIEATSAPGADPVSIESVTGPSYLDLPAPGCWHLDLSWGGGAHTASVVVRVVDPADVKD